jgi:hypothetical protein
MDSDQIDLELLKLAADARELEIKNFWQRSLFFWGFIAATAFAYGDVAKWSDHSRFLESLLAHFGLFSSFCWCYVNKGSKYWYESWERKLRDLERAPKISERIGALLKNRDSGRGLFSGFEPVDPKPFGVFRVTDHGIPERGGHPVMGGYCNTDLCRLLWRLCSFGLHQVDVPPGIVDVQRGDGTSYLGANSLLSNGRAEQPGS